MIMEHFVNIQTLIWFFPIIFVFHDFEEIILMEYWLKNNKKSIYQRLPKRLADNVIQQFSMSTAQFAVAVLVIFLFVSSSTFMASQYVNEAPLGNIYYFTVIILVFFIHVFTHVGQSILFRSVTPGVITSIFLVLPYSALMLYVLMVNDFITWNTIFLCIPFVFLIIPIVLFAHWIGKKTVRSI